MTQPLPNPPSVSDDVRLALGLSVVSLDGDRGELGIGPTDDQGEVIQLAREHLRSGGSFVFNATNLLRLTRRRWIDLFAGYRARVEIVYVEPPMADILEQNKRRERSVPERVIRELAARLEPPTIIEAHSLLIGVGRDEWA